MSNKTISVVIPVYKNAAMVLKNLKHNYPYIKSYDVVIVDDASGDNLGRKIQKMFPTFNVIENEENKGFAPTVNIGVEATKGDLIILLGSDVRLIKPFPRDLYQRFKKHDSLFAISFKQKEKDGKPVGKNYIYFRKGMPHHNKTKDLKKGVNAWADGGSSVVRKEFFKALGGFNEIYAPFYWEDNDLSFRAYSRGWYVLFDPSIYVEHHHESTIGKLFSDSYIQTIAFRNQLIFTWSNITDKALWRQHMKYLPYYIASFTMKGNFSFLKGFVSALVKMSRISKDRERKIVHQVVSDEEIYARFEDSR